MTSPIDVYEQTPRTTKGFLGWSPEHFRVQLLCLTKGDPSNWRIAYPDMNAIKQLASYWFRRDSKTTTGCRLALSSVFLLTDRLAGLSENHHAKVLKRERSRLWPLKAEIHAASEEAMLLSIELFWCDCDIFTIWFGIPSSDESVEGLDVKRRWRGHRDELPVGLPCYMAKYSGANELLLVATPKDLDDATWIETAFGKTRALRYK